MTDANNEKSPIAETEEVTKKRKDGNTCIALGAGVGLAGTAGALAAGAVCPFCVVVAPGLIGLGSYLRWQARDKQNKKE